MGRRTARCQALLVTAAALAGFALSTAPAGCESPQKRLLTIVLVAYQGPTASADARRIADELSAQGLPGTFVVEGAGEATVCLGRYHSLRDPGARQMLNLVRRVRDARGQYPFAGVLMMPVPEPTPKSEWPIDAAPGLYSLYVASWEAPGRKLKAEQYATKLRAEGYEAYVHHGPRFSSVALGGFGLEVFDDPRKVGRPGVKPRIVSPRVLGLMRKFPRMLLEGRETPLVKTPEGKEMPIVPTTLRRIPGREPPAVGGPVVPKALYPIALQLVSTEKGETAALAHASGFAQAKGGIPALVHALTKQILASLEKGRTARIGVVGVRATTLDAAGEQTDRLVLQALIDALERVRAESGVAGLTILGPTTTRQILDAAGLSADDVLRDPRRVKGVSGLDFVIVGTVAVNPL